MSVVISFCFAKGFHFCKKWSKSSPIVALVAIKGCLTAASQPTTLNSSSGCGSFGASISLRCVFGASLLASSELRPLTQLRSGEKLRFSQQKRSFCSYIAQLCSAKRQPSAAPFGLYFVVEQGCPSGSGQPTAGGLRPLVKGKLGQSSYRSSILVANWRKIRGFGPLKKIILNKI